MKLIESCSHLFEYFFRKIFIFGKSWSRNRRYSFRSAQHYSHRYRRLYTFTTKDDLIVATYCPLVFTGKIHSLWLVRHSFFMVKLFFYIPVRPFLSNIRCIFRSLIFQMKICYLILIQPMILSMTALKGKVAHVWFIVFGVVLDRPLLQQLI